MIIEAKFFGESKERSYVADLVIFVTEARTYVLQCNNASASVVLKTPFYPWYGYGKIFHIANGGGSNNVVVKTPAGATVVTIPPGEAADIFLVPNASTRRQCTDFSSYTWYGRLYTASV